MATFRKKLASEFVVPFLALRSWGSPRLLVICDISVSAPVSAIFALWHLKRTCLFYLFFFFFFFSLAELWRLLPEPASWWPSVVPQMPLAQMAKIEGCIIALSCSCKKKRLCCRWFQNVLYRCWSIHYQIFLPKSACCINNPLALSCTLCTKSCTSWWGPCIIVNKADLAKCFDGWFCANVSVSASRNSSYDSWVVDGWYLYQDHTGPARWATKQSSFCCSAVSSVALTWRSKSFRKSSLCPWRYCQTGWGRPSAALSAWWRISSAPSFCLPLLTDYHLMLECYSLILVWFLFVAG